MWMSPAGRGRRGSFQAHPPRGGGGADGGCRPAARRDRRPRWACSAPAGVSGGGGGRWGPRPPVRVEAPPRESRGGKVSSGLGGAGGGSVPPAPPLQGGGGYAPHARFRSSVTAGGGSRGRATLPGDHCRGSMRTSRYGVPFLSQRGGRCTACLQQRKLHYSPPLRLVTFLPLPSRPVPFPTPPFTLHLPHSLRPPPQPFYLPPLFSSYTLRTDCSFPLTAPILHPLLHVQHGQASFCGGTRHGKHHPTFPQALLHWCC